MFFKTSEFSRPQILLFYMHTFPWELKIHRRRLTQIKDSQKTSHRRRLTHLPLNSPQQTHAHQVWSWVDGVTDGREGEGRWDQVFCADLAHLTDARLWGPRRVCMYVCMYVCVRACVCVYVCVLVNMYTYIFV